MKFAVAAILALCVAPATPVLAREALVLTDTAWIAAPSFADVAAVYPSTAREKGMGGAVTLSCVFAADGRLSSCQVLSESPLGLGFGGAAKKLAQRFQGPAETPQGKTIAGARAQIEFKFAPDMLADPVVTHPQWTMLPTPASFQAAFPEAASKAGVLKARAMMRCTVTSAGGLADCESVSEDPPGYGFGQSTLPLAPAFRLKIWGDDGRPVIGGKVKAPIRYELQQASGKP